ncbi:choice-of-anchor D domain-containing protein [Flavobacterium sp.]|uniref:choice-of-anchor D domain-containing protein n=1 Tax=Flavobacterium sp. TaxID=239 RepID=UPI0026171535|nr:choice-of-anchor D domain-containing protein [Flavobacterium sp.]
MKIKILFIALLFSCFTFGQILIPNTTPITQNFDGMGSSATSTLPAGFRVNSTNNYSTGTTATTLAYGTTGTGAVTGTSSGGNINWANGVTASSTDRCLGFLTTGTFSSPRSIILAIQNTNSTNLTDLTISFDYEKYRTGTRAFNWTFFHGSTATAVNTAATSGDQAYAADGANAVVNPPTTISKSFTISGLSIPPSGLYYLCWTYTGLLGATNAQGIGIDNLTLTATFGTGCSTPTNQASTLALGSISNTTADFSWSNGGGTTGTVVTVRPTATAEVSPVNGTSYTANTNYSLAPETTVSSGNKVVYVNNGTSSTITNLIPGTQYTATIYSYNTPNCYNISSPESVTFYTLANEPSSHAASFSCSTISVSQINLTFSAASTITNANGYVILYGENVMPTGVPTDGAIHSIGTVFGNATVAGYTTSSADTTFSVTGLNGGTTYYFLLVPYGVSGAIAQTYNYRTTATIPMSSGCITSIAPEITVRGVIGSNPTISDGDVTPQGTDNTLYTTIVVGNSQAKNFRIQNLGNDVLNVTSINMVGGTAAGDFAVSGITLPTTIAVGASIDFVVTFSPTASGTRNTTLTIVNNDSNENPYDFVIQGTGTIVSSIDINVLGNTISIPDNSLYPIGTNHTAFPVTNVLATSTRIFTIENLGSTNLSLTGTPYITITGPHASSFSITIQPSSNSIPGGSSLTFEVTFAPTSLGAKNATIIISNDDTDESIYNFNISGTAKGLNNIYVYGNGNDVIKGSTSTSLTNLTDFNSVAITTGVKQNTFVITNLAGTSRYFSNVTISGPDATMFTVVSNPTANALANGNSSAFTINFAPTSVGLKNATVSFSVYTDSGKTIGDAIDPTFTFAISGTGIVFTVCNNGPVQIIAQQDFEDVPATPVWSYSPIVLTSESANNGTLLIGGGTYNNGSGVKNAYIGAKSLQFSGYPDSGESSSNNIYQTASITLNPIDVSLYNNINFSMRIGAFRTGSQGLDVNDLIQVETSIDGGTNWSTESVLRGYSNSRWDFLASGTLNAYYTGTNNGATIDTRNGNAELVNGISTYNVRSLPSVANLLIRITIKVDNVAEIWAIDDIKIEGQIPQISIWNGSTWSAGFPTSNTKAIFDADYITSSLPNQGSIEACECLINSTSNVTIQPNYYFEVQSGITNNGTLTVENSAMLVQVNDAAVNSGNIIMRRNANIRELDYVFWSSPIDEFTVSNISTGTPSDVIWKWNPRASNPNGAFGNWINCASDLMEKGKGYIVRGPNGYSNVTPANFTATFQNAIANKAKPNNGIINQRLYRGPMQAANLGTYTSANTVAFSVNDDNWNLVGNPYPSAISVNSFLTYNAVTVPVIEGSVRIWSHTNLPTSSVNPFYNSYQYNYVSSDYITHNGTATISGPTTFDGFIGAGQGFFVLMNDGPETLDAAAPINLVFNNSMRVKTSNSNSQFFKTSNSIVTATEDKHRIWLDLINDSGSVIRTVVGYVPNATLEKDVMYDAFARIDGTQNFYSVIGDAKVCIQGRPVPFENSDLVPLGVAIPTSGNYTIAIAFVDGLFSDVNQNIYLEDKLLNIVHNLRSAPYTFNSTTGVFNDRFVLRYTNTALGNDEFDASQNVIVTTQSQNITIKSEIENITSVIIYDLLGRELVNKNKVNNNEIVLSNINARNQALIVKIILENGKIVTRKIIL